MQKMLVINANMPRRRNPDIVQRWVETGDERCPLAGMWTTLTRLAEAESAEEGDLPGRILPVVRGCAFPRTSMAA